MSLSSQLWGDLVSAVAPYCAPSAPWERRMVLASPSLSLSVVWLLVICEWDGGNAESRVRIQPSTELPEKLHLISCPVAEVSKMALQFSFWRCCCSWVFTLPCGHDCTGLWHTGIWLPSVPEHQLVSLQGNHKLVLETTTQYLSETFHPSYSQACCLIVMLWISCYVLSREILPTRMATFLNEKLTWGGREHRA